MSQTRNIAMEGLPSQAARQPEPHIVQHQNSGATHESAEEEDDNDILRQQAFASHTEATGLNMILEKPHITGIAVSGTIGMGLFFRTGVMITLCGGTGFVIAYCIAGIIISCVMVCLSEMVAFRHSPGVIFDFSAKFVSPALGFAVGIIYWLSYTTSIVTLTAGATELLELSSVPGRIGNSTYSTSGIWSSVAVIVSMIIVIFFINAVGGVKVYGNIEWGVKWYKIAVVMSLWVVMLYIIVKNRLIIGASYWTNNDGFSLGFNSNLYGQLNSSIELPSPSANYASLQTGLQNVTSLQKLTPEIAGSGGVLIGIITAINEAVFSFIGVEILVVAAGEAKNARRDLPKAASQMYIYTIGMYVFTAVLLSFCVSWDDPMLQSYNSPAGYVGASNSPFIVAMTRAGLSRKVIKAYKALFFLSALTTINTSVYVASRTLFALFSNNPKFPWLQMHVGRTSSSRQTPIWAIALSIAPALLALISLIPRSGTTIISVFSSIASVAILCVYAADCWTFICFQKGLVTETDHGEYDRRGTKQYRKDFNRIQLQPFWAWTGLLACSTLILINGWYYLFAAARHSMKAAFVAAGLIGSYFGPLLFLLLLGVHMWKYQANESIDVWNSQSDPIVTQNTDKEAESWKHKLFMWT